MRYKPTYERVTCTLSVEGIREHSHDCVVMQSLHGVFNENESNNSCTTQILWILSFVIL